MFYADGLITLFAFGGVYVSGTFGMSLSEVIVFALVLNVAAGLGAFLSGWVDDWIGSRQTAALALAGLILASIAAVSVQTVALGYGLLHRPFRRPRASRQPVADGQIIPARSAGSLFRAVRAVRKGDGLCWTDCRRRRH